jgi:hypothetical protein
MAGFQAAPIRCAEQIVTTSNKRKPEFAAIFHDLRFALA